VSVLAPQIAHAHRRSGSTHCLYGTTIQATAAVQATRENANEPISNIFRRQAALLGADTSAVVSLSLSLSFSLSFFFPVLSTHEARPDQRYS